MKKWYKMELASLLFGLAYCVVSAIVAYYFGDSIYGRFPLAFAIPVLIACFMNAISFYLDGIENSEKPILQGRC